MTGEREKEALASLAKDDYGSPFTDEEATQLLAEESKTEHKRD
jgi:hypothetical protein